MRSWKAGLLLCCASRRCCCQAMTSHDPTSVPPALRAWGRADLVGMRKGESGDFAKFAWCYAPVLLSDQLTCVVRKSSIVVRAASANRALPRGVHTTLWVSIPSFRVMRAGVYGVCLGLFAVQEQIRGQTIVRVKQKNDPEAAREP